MPVKAPETKVLKDIFKSSFLISFFTLISCLVQAQTPGQNYISKINPLMPIQNEAGIPTISSGVKLENTSYMDGLGRTVQEVSSKISPSGNDGVIVYDYDNTGRMTKKYLPFTSAPDPVAASYKANALSVQQSFYNTARTKFKTNTTAFEELKYDDSPFSLITEQASASPQWALSSGKTNKQSYGFNTVNSIINFDATSYGTTPTSFQVAYYYPAKELLSTTVTNAENHAITTYTDKSGKVICEVELIDVANSIYYYTYYVYNDFGELTAIIPPQGYSNMAQSGNFNFNTIADLIFLYEYDKRGRLTKAKIPGKSWQYSVYNDLDQLVFAQNQKMQTNNQWFFYKYDKLGRAILSGIYTSNSSPQALQSMVDASTASLFEDRTASNFNIQLGYTNAALPTANTEIHSVNYYDDYDFNNDGTDDDSPDLTALSFIKPPGTFGSTSTVPVLVNFQTLGMMTGSWVKVLETNPTVPYLKTAMFYDEKARPVQSKQNNYAGGYDISSTYYDFSGKQIVSEIKHQAFTHTLKTTNRYYYDKVGRVLMTLAKNNNDPVLILSQNGYNEVGQLVEKNIHSAGGSAYLQSIDYTYNELGMITHLNNADLVSGNNSNNDDANDLFGFEVKYNNPTAGGTAKYDGSVSEFHWRSISDATKKAYTCQYDLKNRLTNATYAEYNTATAQWAAATKYNEFGISYDANGNIKALKRNGLLSNSSYGLMDDLSYSYSGNNLMNVTDAAPLQGYNDFKPMGGANYVYDINGNLTTDPSKNLTITYNHLDLPVTINGTGGTMQLVYDGVGVLLKRIFTAAGSSTPVYTYYINGYVYNQAGLKYFGQAEGRVVPNLNGNGWEYVNEYYYTDNQGNTRLCYSDADFNNSINSATEVLQENSYYPFGLDMMGLGKIQRGLVNNEKLNGAEYYPEMNINLHNFGPRNYDAVLGRWLSADPLAEAAPGWTPYRFGFNNPINYNDPSGMIEGDGAIQDFYDFSGGGGDPGGGDDPKKGTIYNKNGLDGSKNAYTIIGSAGDAPFDFHGLMSSIIKKMLMLSSYMSNQQNMQSISVNTIGSEVNNIDITATLQDVPTGKTSTGTQVLDGVQTGLDVVGLVPGVGEIADGINALIYTARGDYVNAGLSTAAMIPFVGWAATGGKLIAKTTKFTKSNMKLGQEMHKLYKVAEHAPELGRFKEYAKIKGIRPDFVDFNTKTIFELKPFNPRGIKSGNKQLEKYKSIFENTFGGEWNTVLEHY